MAAASARHRRRSGHHDRGHFRPRPRFSNPSHRPTRSAPPAQPTIRCAPVPPPRRRSGPGPCPSASSPARPQAACQAQSGPVVLPVIARTPTPTASTPSPHRAARPPTTATATTSTPTATRRPPPPARRPPRRRPPPPARRPPRRRPPPPARRPPRGADRREGPTARTRMRNIKARSLAPLASLSLLFNVRWGARHSRPAPVRCRTYLRLPGEDSNLG